MVQNDLLRQAFEDWIRAIPHLLRPLTAQPEENLRRYLKKASNSSYEFYLFNHWDLWDLTEGVKIQEGRFERVRESRSILDLVKTDEVLARALLTDELGDRVSDERSLTWFVDRYLSRFAFGYLGRREKLPVALDFDKTAFNQVYGDLEQFIYFPATAVTCFRAFLRNLLDVTGADEPRFDRLSVDDTVVVRRLAEDRDPLLNEPGEDYEGLSPYELSDALRSKIVIEVRRPLPELTDYHQRSIREQSLEPLRQAVQTVVDSLRLVQKGSILLGTMRSRPENAFMFMLRETVPSPDADRFAMETESLRERFPDRLFTRRYYPFSHSAVQTLPEMYNRVQAAAATPEISLCLRRLGDSYARANPEDAIVDCWIALEALFAKGDKTELKFRATLRCARYIGDSASDRIVIHKQLKESYDIRSSIVHANRKEINKLLKTNPLAIEDQRVFIQDTLQRILERSVKAGKAPDCNEIDRSFLADVAQLGDSV